MKLTHVFLIIFLVSLTRGVSAQELPVRKTYFKEDNVTVVKTPNLTIVDTPAQLMQLQLVGRSPKRQQPVELPQKISLTLNSHAAAPLFKKDSDRKLVIIVDTEALNLGLLGYAAMRSTTGPKGDYIMGGSSGFVMRFPVPSEALIFMPNQDSALIAETMSTTIQLEQLTKIANANDVELMLGQSHIVLTQDDKRIISDFLRGLMSPGGVVTGPEDKAEEKQKLGEVTDDAPSESNAAPLNQTIEWLKNEIISRSSIKTDTGAPLKIEAIGISDCEIKYSISSPSPTSSYDPLIFAPILEFEIRLAELNPEAIRINDSVPKHTLINLATLDNETSIKALNVEYGSGRVLASHWRSSAQLDLRRTKSAFRIRDAMIHAIKLCRAQQ